MKKFQIIIFQCGTLKSLVYDFIAAKDVYEAKRKYEQEHGVRKGEFVTAQPF